MAKEKKTVDYTSERWKPIAGYPWYEVSDCGRVRARQKRVWVAPNAQSESGYFRVQKAKLLKPIGDHEVVLYHEAKAAKRTFVARLVARAFHGPAPVGKPFVLHGDDDRTNNASTNLRWGSHQDNMDDRTKRDRSAKGTALPQAVLNATRVRKIRAALSRGERHQDIADAFLISKSTVGQIRNGVTWKHIK